mgnify:CR=1 FL=1
MAPFRKDLSPNPEGMDGAIPERFCYNGMKNRTVNRVGRRHVFTKSELLDHTKQLLLEYGYDGFHLKTLSKRLAGARSTIYQYFANKEEIVAACMKREMEEILQRASGIDETDCMNALRQLLEIYLEDHGFHQLLGYSARIDTSRSEVAAADLAFVDQAHTTLQQQLERLFARAWRKGG